MARPFHISRAALCYCQSIACRRTAYTFPCPCRSSRKLSHSRRCFLRSSRFTQSHSVLKNILLRSTQPYNARRGPTMAVRADVAWFVAAVAACLAAAPAAAQVYPTRQIEIVVPFVAGGTTDNIARMLAQRFSDAWRETVIVSNRPGGAATIGTGVVAKAAPDGHTLLVTTIAFTTTPMLQKLPYDAAKDFAPVTELASIPLVLVVHPSVPATTLREFIALAKAEPSRLDYVS